MQYTGIKGTIYETIEPPIGKGGEGSVYKINGMPGSVLKVYSDKCKTETRHKKLQAMLATPLSQEAMQQVTWPTDVVYQNGQFSGYVMPILKNTEALNVMYSDKYNCSFVQRSILARNLCAAVNSVHNANQVCGDLNPNNIKVDPVRARVTLIDTDSYHITDINTQQIYRCEVGLPEYLPSEVQAKMKNGYTLKNAPFPTFTQETDLFALAVHIFALLMNGCHPFACAVDLSKNQSSVVNPQPIDNICKGYFPFYQKIPGLTIPKYAPEFCMLPQEIQVLFIRAFVDGHTDPTKRPSAEEWYVALNKMEHNVTLCKKNKLHEYPNHLSKCPWCELEQRMSNSVIMRPVSRQPLQQTNTRIALSNPPHSATVSTNSRSVNSKRSFFGRNKGWLIPLIVVGFIVLSVFIPMFITSILASINKNDIPSGQQAQSSYDIRPQKEKGYPTEKSTTAVATEGSSFDTAIPINLNSPVDGSFANSLNEKWYKIVLSSSGTVTVKMQYPDQSTNNTYWILRVYDSELNDTLLYWGYTGQPKGNSNSSVLGLSAGIYFIKLYADDNYSSDDKYTITAVYEKTEQFEKETNGYYNNATLVSVNKKYSGAISDANDDDWYSFNLNSASKVVITFQYPSQSTNNTYWKLRVFDSEVNETVIDLNCAGKAKKASSKSVKLNAGTYYIKIYSDDNNTSNDTYHFTVKTS